MLQNNILDLMTARGYVKESLKLLNITLNICTSVDVHEMQSIE